MDRRSNDLWPSLPPVQPSAYSEYADTNDDPGPEQDYALDSFDKQILSRCADHGFPLSESYGLEHSIPPAYKQTTEFDHSWQDIRDDLLDVRQTSNSSSSPTLTVSSPTILALQNRIHTSQRPRKPVQTTYHDAPSTIYSAHVTPRKIPQMQPATYLTSLNLPHAPPTLRGVPIVPTDQLPDHMRSMFSFDVFNIVQSKCFSIAFETNDNLVVAAPTGSGKTAIMELAICQLLATNKNHDFKVVYQAPTKSLCSERYRDWTSRFTTLGLQCGELTGDIEFAHYKTVQQAHVIITTPEKWDSVTRKWRDNAKLMQMIKLFLVDEVHILNETRGATLEAVVSRMKTAGSGVRFVALSATVPNSDDIATWLGRSSTLQHLPAHREVFDESFRPVKLEKHVIGFNCRPNEFALDSILTKEIPKIVAQYAKGKPVMVFCVTKNSAMKSATSLAELWHSTTAHMRLWSGPRQHLNVSNTDLQKTLSAGVAFHHGGLHSEDRRVIEQEFLRGEISIICSTSTLAVGINLPCYLVILKGTSCWGDSGLQEYSSLEVMQMLGRAGRPQFETSACAVILTHSTKTQRYEQMVSGQETLESSLHENLIEHLNAEIGIGTIHDVQSAKAWLASSFLSVRLRKNPRHYHLENSTGYCDPDRLLEQICERDLKLLEAARLTCDRNGLQCTRYGDAMARYYVKYETMLVFLNLPKASRISDILNTLVQAYEFHDLKLRSVERATYKQINTANDIRYPIKGEIALPAHKASLLIQSQLGGVILEKPDAKNSAQFRQDTTTVLNHCNRLIRCIIDMQIHNEDSIAVKHALELCRSIAAGVWDNTPMQLKQIESIGDVTARKLAAAGINNIDTLLSTEPQQIELVLSKSQPFGSTLLKRASKFPSLRVSVKETNRVQKRQSVEIQLQSEIGFINDALPAYFNRKAVYICFLCETSYGKLVDFRRFSATRLHNGEQIYLTVQLDRKSDYIKCHVMCDEITGTHRYAELKLDTSNMSFPRSEAVRETIVTIPVESLSTAGDVEKFDDAGIADDDLLAAATSFDNVDLSPSHSDQVVSSLTGLGENRNSLKRKTLAEDKTTPHSLVKDYREPIQLPNGNWTCQHTCNAEQKACKHVCCREGVKKPRKRAKVSTTEASCKTSIMDTFTKLNSKPAVFSRDTIQDIDTILDGAAKYRKPIGVEQKQGFANAAPSVSTIARQNSSADRQIFDIDQLESDDLPSTQAILQESTRHKGDIGEHLKLASVEDDRDILYNIDSMEIDFDDCDWLMPNEDLSDKSMEKLEASQNQPHNSVLKPTKLDCREVLSTKSSFSTSGQEPLTTASVTHDAGLTKSSFDDNSNNSDPTALNQDFGPSTNPNPASLGASSTQTLAVEHNTKQDRDANQAQIDEAPKTTKPESEEERRRRLHNENQRRRWAQFPQWMYDQFAAYVDIVD